VFEFHWSVKRQSDGSVNRYVVLQTGRYDSTKSDCLNPFYTYVLLSFSCAASAPHASKSHSPQPCFIISMSYLNIYRLQIIFSEVFKCVVLNYPILCVYTFGEVLLQMNLRLWWLNDQRCMLCHPTDSSRLQGHRNFKCTKWLFFIWLWVFLWLHIMVIFFIMNRVI